MISYLRTLLKSEDKLSKLLQKKLKALSNYYGRIELARERFLKPGGSREAGSFDDFLEESMRMFGRKDEAFTKEQLLKIFGDYIVQNFVPKPEIRVQGKRIPIFSTFAEWVIHSLRKMLVQQALNDTNIIQKVLTKGTKSLNHGQLALKKLMVEKLTLVQQKITRLRSLKGDLTSKSNVSSTQIESEAKKTMLISEQLHLAIENHSSSLLRFIDIEACNGIKRKLKNIEKRLTNLAIEILNILSEATKGDSNPIDTIIIDAMTNITEASLSAILEDREEQAEKILQTIFEVAEQTFEYMPEKKRRAKLREAREKNSTLNATLNNLQEQLSCTAVKATLENRLKNDSIENHQATREYIHKEHQELKKFNKELHDQFERLNNCETAQILKEQLGKTTGVIESYLKHISLQLQSAEFKNCYKDVCGDLHNVYALVINGINKLRPQFVEIAEEMEKIEAIENSLIAAQKFEKCVVKIQPDLKLSKIKGMVEDLKKLQFHSNGEERQEQKALLKALLASWRKYEHVNQDLAVHKHFQDLKEREEYLQEYSRFLETLEKQFNELRLLLRQHHDLRPNKAFPTEEAVSTEKKRLNDQIEALYQQIMKYNEDKHFRTHFAPLLPANREELYEKFYPSFFGRSPIFVALYEFQYLRRVQLTEVQQKKQKMLLPQPAVEELAKQRVGHWSEIEGIIKKTHTLVEKSNDNNQKAGEEAFKVINNLIRTNETASEILEDLNFITKSALDVKGYISVGESKIYNKVADLVIPHIAPKIKDHTHTLINAMGKKFHFEQLFLRAICVDIVRSHLKKTHARV